MDAKRLVFSFFFLTLFQQQMVAQTDTTAGSGQTGGNISDILDNYQVEFGLTDTTASSNPNIQNFTLSATITAEDETQMLKSGDLSLAFELVDSASISLIQIELAVLTDNTIQVVNNTTYTLTDFLTLTGSTPSNYVFQNLDLNQIYRVSLLITNVSGAEQSVLTKLYIPNV
ncbi:MAG: hypothetical protein HYZ14_02435 [Bacteroidetes bacterium]|nr:hypothetical protein [Bacteroidota bacterium]